MTNKKVHFFNMIEVLLALTVIAIGMTSVLGLFPVGLNASRNAVAQNCSADVADQLTTYFRVMNESDDGTNYDANFQTIGYIDSAQNTTTADLTAIKSASDAFLGKYMANNVAYTSSLGTDYTRVAPGWAIFHNDQSKATGIYFMVQGPNCTADNGDRSIDFSAMALVWKETSQIKRWNGSGWELWPTGTEFSSTPYKYSGKLNIELSWPLELPYSERKKRTYQIIITNPTP